MLTWICLALAVWFVGWWLYAIWQNYNWALEIRKNSVVWTIASYPLWLLWDAGELFYDDLFNVGRCRCHCRRFG